MPRAPGGAPRPDYAAGVCYGSSSLPGSKVDGPAGGYQPSPRGAAACEAGDSRSGHAPGPTRVNDDVALYRPDHAPYRTSWNAASQLLGRLVGRRCDRPRSGIEPRA